MARSTRVDAIDLRWIKDPKRLKSELEKVVEAYEPFAPETLKHYIPVTGENALSSGNIPSGVEGGTQEALQGADLDGLEMEFNPRAFTFPLTFMYTSQKMAMACRNSHQLLLGKASRQKELLACAIPPYQTNVSLKALREIHNRCSGGRYPRPSNMKYFMAIFPSEDFSSENVPILTRSGDGGRCKFFSREIGEPLRYDILAIGKSLFDRGPGAATCCPIRLFNWTF